METIMYFMKIILMLCGLWLIYKSASKNAKSWSLAVGLAFLGFVFFITGIEFMTPTEQVWSFLLFEATTEDYEKALIGGLLMLSLPIILYAFFGNDEASLLGINSEESSNNPNKTTTRE